MGFAARMDQNVVKYNVIRMIKWYWLTFAWMVDVIPPNARMLYRINKD